MTMNCTGNFLLIYCFLMHFPPFFDEPAAPKVKRGLDNTLVRKSKAGPSLRDYETLCAADRQT